MEITISIPQEVEHILEQQAAAHGQDVKAFVEQIVKTQAFRPLQDEKSTPISETADFDADMNRFAEGTENLTPFSGTYSREEIYSDHD